MAEGGICKKSHDEMITEDEMIRAVEAAASLGIHKLRITGGQPLVKKNILSICARAAGVEGIDELCLTTNGTLLSALAKPLREAGVHRVNISLDTLDPDKYGHITRVGTLKQALRGIEAALDAGFEQLKVNAVLIGGFNDDEIPALARLTEQYPLDVRFIELMPMPDSEEFGQSAMVPCEAVVERLPELEPVKGDGGVAKLYRLPGGLGRVGLISPVSSHFCGTCNRLRLTADGKLKPCLHSSVEYGIKGLDFDGVVEQFKAAVLGKPARHEDLSAKKRSGAGRAMNRIGG